MYSILTPHLNCKYIVKQFFFILKFLGGGGSWPLGGGGGGEGGVFPDPPPPPQNPAMQYAGVHVRVDESGL